MFLRSADTPQFCLAKTGILSLLASKNGQESSATASSMSHDLHWSLALILPRTPVAARPLALSKSRMNSSTCRQHHFDDCIESQLSQDLWINECRLSRFQGHKTGSRLFVTDSSLLQGYCTIHCMPLDQCLSTVSFADGHDSTAQLVEGFWGIRVFRFF